MSYIEQVVKLLLKSPDYAYSLSYLRLRYNLTEVDIRHLVNTLSKDKIARLKNNEVVLFSEAKAYAKELFRV